jgi:hypothetical protein
MNNKSAAVINLRTAISTGDWVRAEALLVEFRGEVETAWKTAADRAEKVALRNHVQETLEWARKTTLTARSHHKNSALRVVRSNAYAEAEACHQIFKIEA